MDEEQELMKRAIKAQEQIYQKENGEKFFAWLEQTFGIKNYKKAFTQDHHAARMNNIAFLWIESGVMTAVVFAKCLFCNDEKFLQKIGTISTLEGLADLSEQDANGNFYFDCGKHNSLEIDAQNRSAAEEEIHIAVQVKVDKVKSARKTRILMN